MQYLLIICHDDSFTPTETLVKEIVAWIKKMKGRGIRVYGNPLRPPSDATTVRVEQERVLGSDLIIDILAPQGRAIFKSECYFPERVIFIFLPSIQYFKW